MQIVTDRINKIVTIADFDPKLFKAAKIPPSFTVIVSPSVDVSFLQGTGRNISYSQRISYAVSTENGVRVSAPIVTWIQQLAPIV